MPVPTTLSRFFARLGPGVVFAVSAIGTSHVVQSTRAGAEHGAYMWLFIVAACLIRYPAFRFGAEYAASTGRSLIDSYFSQGWWAVAIFGLDLAVNMFIATAAIAFVAGGVTNYLFGVPLPDNQTAVLVMLSCLAILVIGHYKALEWVGKIFLGIFSVVVIAVVIKVLPTMPTDASQWLVPKGDNSEESIIFVVALAGWMPTALIAGSFQSLWVCAKLKSSGGNYKRSDVLFDFNFGYVITVILALCFLILGVSMAYDGYTLASSSGEYSAQLVGVISKTLGGWSHLISAIAIFSIMFSTVLTLTDACPRAVSFIVKDANLGGFRKTVAGKNIYNTAIVFQVLVVSIILLFFVDSFREFLDFATTISFLGAPLLAFVNHRAIYSGDIPEEIRPGLHIRIWSLIGIILMIFFGGFYLWIRF